MADEIVPLTQLHNLGALVEKDARDLTLPEVRGVMSRALRSLTGSSGVPKVTGELRGGIEPYAGDAPPLLEPSKDQFYPIHGDADVDRALEGWQMGQEVGLVARAVHSAPILVGGHSKDFPPDRLEQILEEAAQG